MREDIKDTANHLILRYGVRVFRVKDREFWTGNLQWIDTADFLFGFLVGNDRTTVHFTTCTRHGEDTGYRHYGVIHTLLVHVVALPYIAFGIGTASDTLCAVDDRAATHSQYKINVMLSDKASAFEQLGVARIGIDTCQFHDMLAFGLQDVDYLVVETNLLDGGFAIDEQDVLSVGFELVSEFVDGILAKMNPRRILITEVV